MNEIQIKHQLLVNPLLTKHICYYNISNEAYHEMVMVNTGMPHLNSLLKAKSLDLGPGSIIHPVSGELHGVQ